MVLRIKIKINANKLNKKYKQIKKLLRMIKIIKESVKYMPIKDLEAI